MAPTVTEPTHVEGVLIVGGGYAGLHAAAAVRRSGTPLTVVDRTGRHDFVTRLAAVAGGTAPVEDSAGPLRDLVDLVVGSVVAIGDGSVRLAQGHTITAEAVIVAAGSAPSRPPVAGIELAQPLRSAEDAEALRRSIAGSSSLVIIGGGATGVQLAGAAAVAHPRLTVHLVEATTRLLAGMPLAFSTGANADPREPRRGDPPELQRRADHRPGRRHRGCPLGGPGGLGGGLLSQRPDVRPADG